MAYLLFNPAASARWRPPQCVLQGDNRFRVEQLLREAAAEDAPERLIALVPTERRVRWLKRQFFRWVAHFHQGKAAPEPFLFTLAGFLWNCFGRLFPPGRYILLSDAHRLMLYDEAASRAPLRFYRRGNAALPPALLEQLAQLIDGLRRDGITAAVLAERLAEAQHRGDPTVDGARLHDVVALAREYEALLGEELVDEPRGWALVSRALAEGGSRALQRLFPGAELLVVEGFSDFRAPELAFLQVLAQQELPVVIAVDYSPDNGPLFGNFQELVEHLRQAGYAAYSTDPIVLMNEQTPSEQRVFWPLGAYLRRWLFNTEREIRHPGLSPMVTIVECRDREQEVLLIARLVKDLLCRQGYQPHEIAVVMRQPERYSALFREIFALYGIPANVTDRFWLVQSPVAVAVLSLLGLPLNGFRRLELERLVYNPYVRLLRADGRPIDGVNLLTVAMRRRILGGHRCGGADGWRRQLTNACTFLERQLELVRADPYSDPLEREQLERELEACQRALDDFCSLSERLAWERYLYTPAEFLQLLTREILVGMGIYEAVVAAYRQLRQQPWRSDAEWLTVVERIERDARALTRLSELADEIVTLLQRRWGGEARPLADYVERFTAALRGERYQVREKPGAGVTVTSIEQTRGIPFRVLILCGAVDGEFPLPYRTEHLLGYALPQAEDRHRRAERMLFYHFLTNDSEALERQDLRFYITYPTLQEGEQLVRSPFVDELLKVTSLESDGCVINAPKVLRWLQGQEVEGEAADLERQYSRAPWLAVQGTVTEWKAVTWAEPEEQQTPQHSGQQTPQKVEPLQEFIGRYFSASELELYRRCPYRYFATHILRLRPLERAPLELSPLERGLLLHRIVYRFLRELQQRGQLIARPLRGELPPLQTAPLDGELSELYERLREIAREELQHVRFEHPWFRLEAEQLLGTDEQPGILQYWLNSEYDRRRNRPEFEPVAFEFGFGMHPTMADPVPLAEHAWLRGRIDRIELGRQGPEGALSIGVADYKSGPLHRYASSDDCQRGLHLQLPLYLWAAQQILARHYALQVKPSFAAFYALRPHRDRHGGKAEKAEQIPVQLETAQDMLDKACEYAQDAVAQIRARIFPVAPAKRTLCRACPYIALCRVKELQPRENEETAGDTS